MKKIGVIFDCDGTLVDSVEGWRRAERDFARQAGAELSPADVEQLATFTLAETGQFYHTKFGLGKSPADVVRMVDEILISYYETEVELLPGVYDFVTGLAQAGVPLSLASSSPQRYLRPCLEKVGLAEYIPVVLSTDDVNAPKRVPVIYQRCAELMGTAVADTWGFEDSIYAVRTLMHNGFKCVGCYNRDDSATLAQLQAEATLAITSFENFSAQDFLEQAL